MKIALVILHADPTRGGAERYTIDLAAALSRAGHDVSLLASFFSPCSRELARVSCVDLNASGLTRLGRYKRFLNSLDAHLEQTKYDIVHAMLPVRRCDVYHPHAGIAAQMTKRGDALFRPRRSAMARIERELLNGPNRPVVLALSEYVRRSIRETYPLDDDALPILFNAVDLERFVPQPRTPHDEYRALFIGQDFARKGLGPALKATNMIRQTDERLKLMIVGRMPKNSWLPPGLPDVEIVGEVKDPLPQYRRADFFVLPTKHDPCSLVVLEALAMGLPVITTKFNGAAEIMTEGVHGYVLDDPTDVQTLAARMRDLMDDDRRKKMSDACLALRPKLSYEHHLAHLLQIYDTVLAKRGRN